METNIEELIDELRRFADNRVHPIVSPDHWNVYSQLVDFIDELDESLKEQDPVLPPSHLWETYSQTRHGECPKCGADINEYDNSKCCGRCGQEVKWND